MTPSDFIFRLHAIRRMFERRIGEADVKRAIQTGDVIENYPEDTPYPSRLILGWCESRPLHVVVAENKADKQIIIVTVYEPSLDFWEADFKRRKQK